MRERRCPTCGGLVGADAEWCGQCLTRLESRDADVVALPLERPRLDPKAEADAETPVERAGPPASAGPIRVEGGRPVWSCPSCGLENELADDVCRRCSFRFAKLFGEQTPSPRVSPARAAALSAILPGAGHIAAGRVADGVARFVVFAYALGTALVVLLARAEARAGPLVPFGGAALAAALAVYVTGTIDASRAADGRDPIVRNRLLLYGAIALMLLTVIVLVVSGLRVGSAR